MTKARDLANASTALSAVSATELAFVDGVTSAIQTQMDAKASLTGTETLTNKTLTNPVIASVINNTLTSTTGDIIYASGANTPARLGIGSTDQVLKVTAGVPAWATPSSTPPTNGAAYVGANESTTSTSFADLSTAGPAVTLTTGTKAFVILSSRMEGGSTATRGYMGFAVSGATTLAANEGRAQELKVTADQFIDQKSFGYIVTGLTAGSNTFTAKYKSQTGSIVYYTERRLSVVDMGS